MRCEFDEYFPQFENQFEDLKGFKNDVTTDLQLFFFDKPSNIDELQRIFSCFTKLENFSFEVKDITGLDGCKFDSKVWSNLSNLKSLTLASGNLGLTSLETILTNIKLSKFQFCFETPKSEVEEETFVNFAKKFNIKVQTLQQYKKRPWFFLCSGNL